MENDISQNTGEGLMRPDENSQFFLTNGLKFNKTEVA